MRTYGSLHEADSMHQEPLIPSKKKSSTSRLLIVPLIVLFAFVMVNFANNGFQENSELQDQSSSLGVAVGMKKSLIAGAPPPENPGAVPGAGTSAAGAMTPPQSGSPQATPPGFSTVPQADPAGAGAMCSHEDNGYESRVKLCNINPSHKVFLALLVRVGIPKALNLQARCKGPICTEKDESVCCGKRPQCMAYIEHVREGCPVNTRANPYQYAFCTTNPCTINDLPWCCLKVEASVTKVGPASPQFHALFYDGLYERISSTKSKFAKDGPSDNAKDVTPKIVFGPGDFAWFDMARARTEPGATGETWAPLMNFMRLWREDMGWETEAWMKLKAPEDVHFRQMISDLDGNPMSWIKKAKEEAPRTFLGLKKKR